MKVLNIIRKIIVGVLLVTFFAFAITMTIFMLNINNLGVTQLDDTSFIIIKDDISSDNYKKGDLVLVKRKKIDKINVGDELFVFKVQKTGAPQIDVGIVGEVYADDEAISFENGGTYSMKYVAGETNKVYNGIGTPLSIVQSKWGFLFIILVPSFLIFIYELYAIVVEIKYGKESETK